MKLLGLCVIVKEDAHSTLSGVLILTATRRFVVSAGMKSTYARDVNDSYRAHRAQPRTSGSILQACASPLVQVGSVGTDNLANTRAFGHLAFLQVSPALISWLLRLD